jgi:hypothetical protein
MKVTEAHKLDYVEPTFCKFRSIDKFNIKASERQEDYFSSKRGRGWREIWVGSSGAARPKTHIRSMGGLESLQMLI